MRFLGIDSTCRASFYFYNTKEDVDRLIKGLNKAYNMFKKIYRRKIKREKRNTSISIQRKNGDFI